MSVNRAWTVFSGLRHDERGTAFIEYIIVAAVAVVVVLGAVQAFFGGVAEMWDRLTAMVTGAA